MKTSHSETHSKPPINKERRNKAKYLTWNSIRLKLLNNTRVPNSVKNLLYIKCCSSSSPRSVKSPSSSIRYNCQKIFSWSRRPKTILEIKKGYISQGDQQSYYLQNFLIHFFSLLFFLFVCFVCFLFFF